MKYTKMLKHLIKSFERIELSIEEKMIESDFEDDNEYRLLIRLPLNMGIIFTMSKSQEIDEIFVYGLEETFGNINTKNINNTVNKIEKFYQSCVQIKYFDKDEQEKGTIIYQTHKKPKFENIQNIWKDKIVKQLKYEVLEDYRVVTKDYRSIGEIEVTYKLNEVPERYKIDGFQVKKRA